MSTWGQTLDRVANLTQAYFPQYEVTRHTLRNLSKEHKFVKPRQFACAVLHHEGYSYTQIGRALGNKDHTSALHNTRVAEGVWGEGFFERLAEWRSVCRKRQWTISSLNAKDKHQTFINGKGWRNTEPLRVAS